MDLERVNQLIRMGESIEREFKSDRKLLNDKVVFEEVVAMANTNGGTILVGVEDDGTVTGCKPRHGSSTDPRKLQAAIFNNTVPNINTRVSTVSHPAGVVLCIEMDPYPEPCATSSGKSLRRATGADGKPQTIPFYPRDQRTRRTDLGLLDFSAQPCPDASWADLDPLEFERIRKTVRSLHGDSALLSLSDEELAKALQLVETTSAGLVPNLAGVLLLGREGVLQRALPTHEAAFQVLDARKEVRVNDFFRQPLLRTIEELQSRFDSRVEEEEVMIGMFRLAVPEYGREAFREALLNALLHRDYTQLGTVFVQWHADHLFLSNPGGLPDGVILSNLLVHEPKPRNPRLYDAAKRIGLVEKTGRGVDKIFQDQLRLGRPAPNYQRTDQHGVRIVLPGGKANLAFAKLVFELSQEGKALALDELMIVNLLCLERQIDLPRAMQLIQKTEGEAQMVLESLSGRGLIQGKGERRVRVYLLSPLAVQRLGLAETQLHARGVDPRQQEQRVLQYVDAHGKITRSEAASLCQLSEPQATRFLKKMCNNNVLKMAGAPPKGAYYIRP